MRRIDLKLGQFLLPLLLSGSLSATPPTTQAPPPAQTLSYLDFAHPHKGCPENSDCDAAMGAMLERWEALAERWNGDLPRPQLEKEVQQQLAKSGWPVEFYTRIGVKPILHPVLFNSSCPAHNPKDAPSQKVLRGQAFLRGIEDDQALVTLDSTETKIKLGELLQLQPVLTYPEKGAPVKYLIPLEERPAFLEKGKLHILTEIDDFYVVLVIGATGLWDVQLPPAEGMSQYFDDRQDIECPKDVPRPELPWFQKVHCQRILDKDTGKTVIAAFAWAC